MFDDEQLWSARCAMVPIVERELNQKVKEIYVIGSYANYTATESSDIDFLVELEGVRKFPTWGQIMRIQRQLPQKVHVIFGTREAQVSTGLPFRMIPKEIKDANSRSTANPRP